MSDVVRLGISTCPNDTFAFHGLLNGLVDLRGIVFEAALLDIEELNRGIIANQFDVAKASFALAYQVADAWYVLPSGSALGFGVGPLLLAAEPNNTPVDSTQISLCPGEHTTATMLFRAFFGQTQIRQVLFSQIIPGLQNRIADFGVCIHEGRFTYQESGLYLVEDLGNRWEQETGCPLPLGGILARRNLGKDKIHRVQSVIRDSIELGLNCPEATMPTMRRYAQEFDDDVLMSHVDLYVNKWTLDLAEIGRQALAKMSAMIDEFGPTKPRSAIEVFLKGP